MDGLQFTDKLIEHLVTLAVGYAWPAVIIVLFYTQRVAIAEFLEDIKTLTLKAKGVELVAERAKATLAEVKTDLKEVKPPELPAPVVEERLQKQDGSFLTPRSEAEVMQYLDEYSLAQAAQAVPRSVIERAWYEVERALYRLVEGQDRPAFTYLTGNDLLRMAAERKLLDPKLLEGVSGLLAVYNDTVTGVMGWQPSQSLAAQYVHSAAEAVKFLRPYQLKLADALMGRQA